VGQDGYVEPVVVQDGPVGRDPALVTDRGGEVFHEFETEQSFDIGDRLTLPDGTEVKVIQVQGEITESSVTQILTVANVSPRSNACSDRLRRGRGDEPTSSGAPLPA
jgi:hypothetical protein